MLYCLFAVFLNPRSQQLHARVELGPGKAIPAGTTAQLHFEALELTYIFFIYVESYLEIYRDM